MIYTDQITIIDGLYAIKMGNLNPSKSEYFSHGIPGFSHIFH